MAQAGDDGTPAAARAPAPGSGADAVGPGLAGDPDGLPELWQRLGVALEAGRAAGCPAAAEDAMRTMLALLSGSTCCDGAATQANQVIESLVADGTFRAEGESRVDAAEPGAWGISVTAEVRARLGSWRPSTVTAEAFLQLPAVCAAVAAAEAARAGTEASWRACVPPRHNDNAAVNGNRPAARAEANDRAMLLRPLRSAAGPADRSRFRDPLDGADAEDRDGSVRMRGARRERTGAPQDRADENNGTVAPAPCDFISAGEQLVRDTMRRSASTTAMRLAE